jgi:hypothetical protein
MATRGWGKARKKAAGGFIDPAATKAKEINPKPEFTRQAINKPKTHHDAVTAINQPKTQRTPWQKLE